MIYEKGYYITVKEFKMRQLFMEKQINKYDLNINKFEGINKYKINLNKLVKTGLIKHPFNIRKHRLGTLACCLSHVLLYMKIYNENKDNDKEIFLILEDDAFILPDFKKKLEFYYKYIPKNWDMVWLGYNKFLGKQINKYVGVPTNNPPGGVNACHHCYLIKKSSIQKILKILVPLNYISSMTKDLYIRKNFDKFNAYFILNDRLAIQNTKFISTRTGGVNG